MTSSSSLGKSLRPPVSPLDPKQRSWERVTWFLSVPRDLPTGQPVDQKISPYDSNNFLIEIPYKGIKTQSQVPGCMRRDRPVIPRYQSTYLRRGTQADIDLRPSTPPTSS